MLGNDSVQLSPLDGDRLKDKDTVPEKPFSEVTTIVEVPSSPETTVTLVGVAAIVEDTTVRSTVAYNSVGGEQPPPLYWHESVQTI
jgi:hypothetical protein